MANEGSSEGQPPSSLEAATEAEVCAYVSDMCAELMALARGPRLELLAYLLGMARHEAERIATGKP